MKHSDRPFSRKIVKLAFALLAGRARAHGQDCWPGLKIDTAAGRVLYRGAQAARLSPAALPSGLEEITVVGSGPSIRDQDLTRLPPRSTILLNGAITLCDRIAPLAIAVEDERFVWRHGAELRRVLAEQDCLFLLSPAVIRALLSQDRSCLGGRKIALIDNLLKPVNGKRRKPDDPALRAIVRLGTQPGSALSLDPGRGIMPAGTVAFSALQFALAALPRRIGLAGIDLSNAAQPRFYETAGEQAASGIVTGLERILAGFSLAHALAAERGIALACYSPVSALLGIGYSPSDRLSAVHRH